VGDVYVWADTGADGSELTLTAEAECVTQMINGLPQNYMILQADGVYGIVETAKITLSDTAVSLSKMTGQAVLVLASYQNDVLVDIEMIPVTGDISQTISETGLTLEGADWAAAFLWEDILTMKPVCREMAISLS